MSQTFQRYDEEFNTLTKQVKSKFEDNGGGGYKDEETGASTETPSNISAGDMLDQCDELLQQMALEARSSETDAGLKRELLVKVRNYKNEIKSLKDENNKRSLMSSATRSGVGGNGSSQRQKLLQQQEMMKNQNNQLDSARRVLQETEQVALEIGEELQSNRATIESAHGRVRQVTTLTGRARRVVASMNQRAVQQKMLLYGLAASVVIVFFIFIKWMR
ncbi:MAG: Fe2+ transport system protein B [Bacillariaceae sp.]|jgi:Fe2+ transport system protein B